MHLLVQDWSLTTSSYTTSYSFCITTLYLQGRDIGRDISYNKNRSGNAKDLTGTLSSILTELEGDLAYARETLAIVTSSRDDEKKRALSLSKEATGLYDLAKEIISSGGSEENARKFLLKRQEILKLLTEAVNIEAKLSSEILSIESSIEKLAMKLVEVEEIALRDASLLANDTSVGMLPGRSTHELEIPSISSSVDPLEERFRKLEEGDV